MNKALTKLAVPEGLNFGPAMRALNERQRDFVYHLYALGCRDPVDASRAAGYPDTSPSGVAIRTQTWRLMHHDGVKAAIEEEGKRRFKADVPFAHHLLLNLAENEQTKDNVRLAAGLALLNRGGFHEKTEHTVSVHHTYEAKVQRLRELAIENGEDPAVALGDFAGPMTDAEYEEVPADLDDLADFL